jgi:hypothetical protein
LLWSAAEPTPSAIITEARGQNIMDANELRALASAAEETISGTARNCARTGVHTAKFRPDQAALPEKLAD